VAALAARAEPTRIGVVRRALEDDLDPEVAAALAQAVAAFTEGGGAVEVELADSAKLSGLADVVMKSEAAAIHGRWMKDRPGDYARPVFSRNEAGFHIPAARYIEALSARGPLASAFIAEAFAHADLLLLPAAPMPAPTFAAVRSEDPEAIGRLVAGLTRFVRPFNYLGLPALVIPCGASASGLPIGIQVVGRPFGEARLLAAAHAYQQRTGWHCRRPARPSRAEETPR
jgi:aspartyl-tRNA(Asn)/glutamyl-tRNA(Gln) amidotransferase subunit A